MRIVPVIDIRNGAVVRAIAGRRADYRPLRSRLTAAATPLAVARGLMGFFPFDTLYVADLDAIEGRGDNRIAIIEIGEFFPAVEIWVDPGVRRPTDAARWRGQKNLRLVLGSESLLSREALSLFDMRDACVLSLDFQDGRFLGDPDILDAAALWPSQIIVMSLTHVGGDAGPDVARLAGVSDRAGRREVYGAGGVRDCRDLAMLAAAGATGALISSALHDGRLTAADLSDCLSWPEQKKGARRLPLNNDPEAG